MVKGGRTSLTARFARAHADPAMDKVDQGKEAVQ